MRFSFWAIATLFALLAGCTTVQKSKSLTVYPADAPVTVTSNADARCWDIFAVVWCRLNVEMESSSPQKVSGPTDQRLTALRDLYNRKLISTEVYDQETRKAIKELGD